MNAETGTGAGSQGAAASQTSPLRVEFEDSILTLTLSRPDKYNALNREMLEGIEQALATHDRARAVLLLAEGRAFAAGADIALYSDASADDLFEFTALANRVVDGLAGFPAPVVACVQGVALGGGCELVLASDIAIGTPAAQLGLPEIQLGLIPGWGGTQRLTEAVGSRRAKRMIFLAERICASDALACGLLSEILEPASLEERGRELARDLATRPAEALDAAKRAITEHTFSGDGYQLERRLLAELFQSADGVEGVRAFVEKRDPRFE